MSFFFLLILMINIANAKIEFSNEENNLLLEDYKPDITLLDSNEYFAGTEELKIVKEKALIRKVAREYYIKQYIELGLPNAYHLKTSSTTFERFKLAKSYYINAANDGDVDAQYTLGRIYLDKDISFKQEPDLAIKYFLLANDNGSKKTQSMLDALAIKRKYHKKNTSNKEKYQCGDLIFDKSSNTRENYLNCLNIEADKGDLTARRELGIYYLDYYGNYEKQKKNQRMLGLYHLTILAKEVDCVNSQYILGLVYMSGHDPILQNIKLAKEYLTLAANADLGNDPDEREILSKKLATDSLYNSIIITESLSSRTTDL